VPVGVESCLPKFQLRAIQSRYYYTVCRVRNIIVASLNITGSLVVKALEQRTGKTIIPNSQANYTSQWFLTILHTL
jgi:hypothetical protein